VTRDGWRLARDVLVLVLFAYIGVALSWGFVL